MVVRFITRQVEPDLTALKLTGQLNLGNALTGVEQALRQGIQRGSKRLVLELSKLTFLDSSGVGMLVVCSGVMERTGERLVIAGAGGKVKEVLELTHLDRVTGMY